jgi:hypothetical protein
MAPNETMPHMLKGRESWATNDGYHVMVLNPNEMISTIAPMIRVNAQLPEP